MMTPVLPQILSARSRSAIGLAACVALASLGLVGDASAIEKMRLYQHPTKQTPQARSRMPDAMTFEGYELRLSADEASADGQPPPDSREAAVLDAAPQALSGGVTYWLLSDYVFRGLNFSDYDGEGAEAPNHQLTASLALDLAAVAGRQQAGEWGSITFSTFLEWYTHQDKISSEGSSFQEYDFSLSYAYEFKPIATTLSATANFYVYPYGKEFNTVELMYRLDHNDAWAWKWLWPDNEDGVLNPFVSFSHDIDAFAKASWLDFGFSHDFALFEHLTVTPGITFGTDMRYLDRVLGTGDAGSIRLAYSQYALTVGYDLSGALQLPESAGSWVLSGFLYFNQALGEPKRQGLINDELFGGMSIGWSF